MLAMHIYGQLNSAAFKPRGQCLHSTDFNGFQLCFSSLDSSQYIYQHIRKRFLYLQKDNIWIGPKLLHACQENTIAAETDLPTLALSLDDQRLGSKEPHS